MAALLLNADGAPVSYLPLSIISWEDAIRYMVSEKASPLEFHEDWIVHSENWQTAVPSVMILREYEKRKTTIRYSKQNVFIRDKFMCQYCGVTCTHKDATLDHVLPTSHGGKSTWDNSTTACSDCNASKGNNKKIVPKSKPYTPNYFQLAENRKIMGWKNMHSSWLSYIM